MRNLGSQVLGLCVLKTVISLEPDFPRVLVDQMDGTMTKGTVVPRSPKSYIPLF